MKILQVVNGYPPVDQAGTELCTYQLSKSLAERGHELHVFCREAHGNTSEFSCRRESLDGVDITRLNNNLLVIDNPMMYYKNHRIESIFRDYLRALRPDIVHFQHCIGLSASLIYIVSSARYPALMTLHDFWFLCERIQLLRPDGTICDGPEEGANCVACLHSPENRRPGPIASHPMIQHRWAQRYKRLCPAFLRQILKRFLVPGGLDLTATPSPFPTHSILLSDTSFRVRYLRETLKKLDLLLTPSRFMKQVYVDHGIPDDKIMVLPHGVKPAGVQSKITAEPGKISFLFMGVIMPHKGLHVLLKAFQRLDPSRVRLECWGCPTPEHEAYYARLQREVEGWPVTFHGRYDNSALAQILSRADLLVVPSLWKETFSVVSHEAFTAGVPVAAPSIGVFPEIVHNRENGILFRVGDAEDLADKLKKIVSEPGILQRFTKRMPVVKGVSEHAAEMEAIYHDLVQR